MVLMLLEVKKVFSDCFANTPIDVIIGTAAIYFGMLTAIVLEAATVLGSGLIVAASGFLYVEVMTNSMKAYGVKERATKALKGFWEDTFCDEYKNEESK